MFDREIVREIASPTYITEKVFIKFSEKPRKAVSSGL